MAPRRRNRTGRAAVGAILCLLAWPSGSAAQEPARGDTARLVGQVVSALTGKPIGGAVVSLQRSGLGAVTDSSGNFAIPKTLAGQDTVEVRYIGFEDSFMPLYLEPDLITRVVLLLSPTVVRLADLKVEVERKPFNILSGFEERKARGMGYFFDLDDIQRRAPRYTSDLLRQVPGLRVGPNQFGKAQIVSGRSGILCTPAVFLDGINMPEFEVDEIIATDLGAVEVYRGASELPPMFASAAASGCGAIVIWTRRGFQRTEERR
ncbi:MAG: carboxypeptidase-like regulatory domain-containing protein [Gemmatimonadota bacterium]